MNYTVKFIVPPSSDNESDRIHYEYYNSVPTKEQLESLCCWLLRIYSVYNIEYHIYDESTGKEIDLEYVK